MMSIPVSGEFNTFETVGQPQLFFHFGFFLLFVAVSVIICLQFFGEFGHTAHVSLDVRLTKVINLMQLEPRIDQGLLGPCCMQTLTGFDVDVLAELPQC